MSFTQAEFDEFVTSHFRAKQNCDRDALASQFAADVVLWAPRSLTDRGFVDRPFVGADRLIDVITSDYFYKREGRDWTVEDYVGNGDKLSVRATLRATVAATGGPFEMSYTFFYRLSDGRIAETWEQFDTAKVVGTVEPTRAEV